MLKYEIGYIKAWRSTIFLVTVFSMIILGISMSVAGSVFGPGIISGMICLGAIFICIILMIITFADKFRLFEGFAEVEYHEEGFRYKDKKKKIEISYSDIKKLDIQPIKFGEGIKYVIAYRILIEADNKKFYIESDRAGGRTYTEVDIYKLYLELQKRRS